MHLTSIAVFVSSFEQFKHDPYVGHPITKLLQQLDLFQSRLPEVKRRLRKDTALIPPIQPKIVLRAFGGAQIVINGKEVNRSDWKSSIQREIIFYLLHHPEGASKTKLLDLIWGDKKSGANQLANMLYKMRRFLGEDLVEYRAERYYFNRQMDYDYDVERFLLYREQIRQETDPVMKANLYQQMTQLYQGTFLPEGSWLWIVPEQERLWQIYLDAALGLGEYYLDKGEYYTCLEICWQVLKHGAQSENIYRLAMRTAAAMGDRASVDHYYQLCRQTSRKTSGFDPSQETCTLYQQLMR